MAKVERGAKEDLVENLKTEIMQELRNSRFQFSALEVVQNKSID